MDFFVETLKARRKGDDITKVMGKKIANKDYYNWQYCPLEIKEKERHSQTNKSWEFKTTRPVLQEMLKGVLRYNHKEKTCNR